jgi:hypothetical protein
MQEKLILLGKTHFRKTLRIHFEDFLYFEKQKKAPFVGALFENISQ